MSDELKFMPLFVDQIMTSLTIREMTPAARSAYFMLLVAQWKYRSLPNSLDTLADLAMMAGDRDEFRAIWEQHLSPLFVAQPNGRLANENAAKIRAEQERKHAAAVAKSQNALARRWNKPFDPTKPRIDRAAAWRRFIEIIGGCVYCLHDAQMLLGEAVATVPTGRSDQMLGAILPSDRKSDLIENGAGKAAPLTAATLVQGIIDKSREKVFSNIQPVCKKHLRSKDYSAVDMRPRGALEMLYSEYPGLREEDESGPIRSDAPSNTIREYKIENIHSTPYPQNTSTVGSAPSVDDNIVEPDELGDLLPPQPVTPYMREAPSVDAAKRIVDALIAVAKRHDRSKAAALINADRWRMAWLPDVHKLLGEYSEQDLHAMIERAEQQLVRYPHRRWDLNFVVEAQGWVAPGDRKASGTDARTARPRGGKLRTYTAHVDPDEPDWDAIGRGEIIQDDKGRYIPNPAFVPRVAEEGR